MRYRSRIKTKKGYTLTEVLLVVAIVSILAGVAFVAVMTIQKGLRQKELDTKAETMYVAVQNQMSKLRTSGASSTYTDKSDMTKLTSEPSDWDPPVKITSSGPVYEACNLYDIRKENGSQGASSTAAYTLVSSSSVDSQIRDNYWVVEYDPATGVVYSVFYWENKDKAMSQAGVSAYSFSAFDEYRESADVRKAAGGYIGYYGGSALSGGSNTTGSKQITIVNGEKLYATCQYALSSTTSKEVVFTITLEDQSGHTREIKKSSKNTGLTHLGKRYYCTLMLDDLTSESTRFYNVYGKGNTSLKSSEEGNQPLNTGDIISIKLKVSMPTDNTFQTVSFDGGTFNSLYGNDSVISTDKTTVTTADIAYARHLQNLDDSAKSDLKVTGAVQTNDISFKDNSEDEEDWYTFYNSSYYSMVDGKASFEPISNTDLESYQGSETGTKTKYHVISAIPIKTANAGLFESVHSEAELKDIRMTAPVITSTDDQYGAGALFGVLSDKVTIDSCQVYLDESDDDLDDKNNNDLWISGLYTGGLIGQLKSGSNATIKDSFASLVVGDIESGTYGSPVDNSVAGGLIGYAAAGNATITRSYADSYIYGDNTGGVVGLVEEEATITANYVYTSGFLNSKTQGAGLVNGAATIKNSYAYTHWNQDSTVYYSTINDTSSGSADNVWYYEPGSIRNSANLNASGTSSFVTMNAAELLAKLGSTNFTTKDNTTPYNLTKGMALTNYPYPRIKDIAHYGDWATEFTPGALVYYERYVSDPSGVRFYGGNVSTLYDNLSIGAVYGDGYGIVYRSTDELPDTATVETEYGTTETITFASATHYSYTDDAGITYNVYPLETANVNPVFTEEKDFYQSVKLTYKSSGASDIIQAYYFNPHFARAVGYLSALESGEEVPDPPELPSAGSVYIRAARHLYNMSLYYKYYRNATEDRTFRQTWELSYTDYDWSGYFNASESNYDIARQNPIGTTDASFTANYNGGNYRIRNISFVLANNANGNTNDYNGGLFGINDGTISNVVLWADYNESGGTTDIGNFASDGLTHYYVSKESPMQYYVGTDENIGKNQTMHMGILAGSNSSSGRINNCAVAGYYMANTSGTIRGYENSYLYAGALVGGNNGVITSCSADTPYIRITTNYANAFISGFVGENNGSVSNSYALSHIEVVNPKGGSIVIAGFAGINNGELSSDYAVGNMQTSGDMTTPYPFSPTGGVVYNCDYLSAGTYSYANHLYPYVLTGGSGTARTRDELIAAAGTEITDAAHSIDYASITDVSDTDVYPYRAVVTDASGNRIHYGDWTKDANLGKFGIFYWEKESGGNEGYHITYVGIEGSSTDYVTQSTLCTAHDDGGVITEYGYGYYSEKTLDGTLSLSVGGSAASASDNTYTVNNTAKSALENDFEAFTFYPYNTLSLGADTSSAKQLYLLNNSRGQYDTWNLSYTKTGDASAATTLNYYVAPFFANAIQVVNSGVSSITLTTTDGLSRDFVADLGVSGKNNYDVRNIAQLQYINWNYDTKTADALNYTSSDADNKLGMYTKYSYLAYTTTTTTGTLTRDSSGNHSLKYWVQTHDIDGSSYGNFTPLGGTGITSDKSANEGGKATTLYSWFDGGYDGQSYRIEDLSITTNANAVGMFGTTVSAILKNIILYSENDTMILRSTSTSDKGAYFMGGLVGTMILYNEDTSAETSKVSNCAIAGYIIRDKSRGRQTTGCACVGGLIGQTYSGITVDKCSAVVDLQIDGGLTEDPRTFVGAEQLRIGGLCGTVLGTVSNSYTGGSISVTGDVLTETYNKNKNKVLDNTNASVSMYHSKNLFIGGIGGGNAGITYSNFTGKDNASTYSANPKYKNCYTYVDFPDLRGSIRSISMIGNLGEYAGYQEKKCTLTQENCYYLDTCAYFDTTAAPMFYFSQAGSVRDVLNDNNNTYRNYMINGDPLYMERILSKGSISSIDGRPTAVTYNELSDMTTNDMATRLGSEFGWVTTQQGTATINGKFSFGGNNRALDGLNYPFPTVITQRDLIYSQMDNVHYGEWPLRDAYWENARDEMDIFANRTPSETDATITENLMRVKGDISASDFVMDVGGIVEITEVTRGSQNADDNTCYDWTVKFKALKTGTETISITNNGRTTTLTLEVTATMNVTTDPSAIAQGIDQSQQLTMYAKSTASSENDYSTNVKWTVTIQDEDYAEATTVSEGTNTTTIKSNASGRTQIIVSAAAEYNGVTYTTKQYVGLLTYGVIGMSNNNLGSGNVFYSEASRANTGTYTGTNYDTYHTTEAPVMAYDGDDVYLYESYSDDTLGSATIKSVKLGDEDAQDVSVDDGTATSYGFSNYVVDIGSPTVLSSDANFRYRPMKVRPKDNVADGDVVLTITLKDGETEATYKLSGTIHATHVITYDLNGKEGTLATKAQRAGTSEVVASAATATGYTFVKWNTQADGTGTDYTPGDALSSITTDITLYAQWNANTYTVKYNMKDSNNKPSDMTTDEISDQPFTYDDTSCALPTFDDVKSAYSSVDWNSYQYALAGWNTAADGSGTTYALGQAAPNISSVSGDVVTLYPIWSTEVTYTWKIYRDNGDLYTSGTKTITPGGSYEVSLPDASTLTKDYYRLVGFTSNVAVSGSTTHSAGSTVTVTGCDIEFTADWENNRIILSNKATGEWVNTEEELAYGSTKISTVPTRDGYDFFGWYTGSVSDSGAKKITDNTGTLVCTEEIDGLVESDGGYVFALKEDKAVTLYARWRKTKTVYLKTDADSINSNDNTLIVFDNDSKEIAYTGTTTVQAASVTPSTTTEYYYSDSDMTSQITTGTSYLEDGSVWTYAGNGFKSSEGYYLGANWNNYSIQYSESPSNKFVKYNNNCLSYTTGYRPRRYYLSYDNSEFSATRNGSYINDISYYEETTVYICED